jgi:hypothetical protein
MNPYNELCFYIVVGDAILLMIVEQLLDRKLTGETEDLAENPSQFATLAINIPTLSDLGSNSGLRDRMWFKIGSSEVVL